MIDRQLELELDQVEAGMTLSAAIFDAHDGVLLPAGVELTESILASLHRRGIDKVLVINDRISEADLALERERLQQRLAKLFRNCTDNGASNSLRDSILRYRMGESS